MVTQTLTIVLVGNLEFPDRGLMFKQQLDQSLLLSTELIQFFEFKIISFSCTMYYANLIRIIKS